MFTNFVDSSSVLYYKVRIFVFSLGVRFTDLKKEREMVKWEHMKAMDYLREPSQKGTGKRGAAESRAVVFRGGAAGPMPGPVMDLKSEMSSVTEASSY